MPENDQRAPPMMGRTARPDDNGGEKAVEHGDAVDRGLALAWRAQPAIELVERHWRPHDAGYGGRGLRGAGLAAHAAAFMSSAARAAFHSHGSNSCRSIPNAPRAGPSRAALLQPLPLPVLSS